MDDEIAITELTKIDADRVDGVGTPANGIPFLLLKSVEPVEKDWAAWDAAHEGGGSGSNAGASSAWQQAHETLAEEKEGKGKGKNGKKPTAAELHNAHLVHLAHEEHLHHEHEEHVAHEEHVGHHAHETHEEHAAAVRAERGQTHPASNGKTSTLPKPTSEQEAKDAALSRKSALAAIAKAVDADGTVDEGPDVDLGQQIMGLLGQAIINEAQEIKAGMYGETCDVDLLNSAANLIQCWISRESSPDEGSPMGMLMAAAKAAGDDVAKRNVKTGERKKLADKGHALPDGSYPIANAGDLDNAATLARSGHGDAEAAKRLIARRAKELGVANPLDDSKDDDASKSVSVAEGEADVQTEPQGSEAFAKALADAVTKATAPLEERLKALDAELAKVKATPIPGGPMMSTARPSTKAADGEDWAAKSAYYRAQADAIADPATADGYRQLARQADDKANATI